MKKLFMIIIILSSVLYGQVSADLTIENQQVVGTDFFFDIYLTRTATEDVYLGTADFVLTFNSVAFTSPVITKESSAYWNLTSTTGNPVGTSYRLATSTSPITVNEIIINLELVNFGGDQAGFDEFIAKINNTPTTHRIGRYKISGISNPADYMNLQWKTTGTGVTTQVFTLAPVSPWTSLPVTINAINPPNALLNSNPTTFQLSVSYANGWNMASVPGQNPDGMGVNIWWAYRDPLASVFVYSGGYQAISETTPGTGYWMKHSEDRTYNTGDEWPAGGINIVPHNSINANAGWNLIGGYEYNAAVSGITTIPAGLQSSAVYGYSGGYQVVDYLIPGHGYWIKLSAPGLINLPAALEKGNSDIQDYINDDWGRIIISDASGKSYTLYAVNGQVDLNNYELPPLPPAGMFDVRFGNGRFAEDLSVGMKSIEMSGLEYPIIVHVQKIDLRIQDKTGKQVNSSLKSGEEISISSSIQKLLVSADVLPDKYSLEQNYPNPFNPSTKIEFSITEDGGNVTLTIYNALGQKVAELVNSKLDAGRYSYNWNADDEATGIYIYELRTDKFVSVKKMILLR
jgi:hypothetical protein